MKNEKQQMTAVLKQMQNMVKEYKKLQKEFDKIQQRDTHAEDYYAWSHVETCVDTLRDETEEAVKRMKIFKAMQ